MLQPFQAYLTTTAHIKVNYIPYYLKWVSDCYAFLDCPIGQAIGADQKQQFLKHISKRHEEWQVKQADYALRLYGYFLSRTREESSIDSSTAEEGRKRLEEDARRALRLRHRSYNTEKTYLAWLRHFCRFANGKAPQEWKGDDLQDFLTHLAVEKRVSAATRNQALNAIVFVFRHLLEKDIEGALQAVRAIRERLAEHLIQGIQYEKINEWYEMTQFEDIPSWEEYLVPGRRSVYDQVVYDSEIEREFVEGLEKMDDVKLYLKLPGWFTVDIPVGAYNPDWAIVMEERDAHGQPTGAPLLYLVRETKPENWKTSLRPEERRKIECGGRHFQGALQLDYKVLTRATELP